jgi:sigma-B regulation protein RsbU (phosphoserine phosphatase)
MGVIAAFDGDLEELLSAESDVFVRLMRSDDPDARSSVKLKVGTREYALRTFGGEKQTAKSGVFFGQRGAGSRLWDRPILVWGEISGSYRSLADGGVVADYLVAALRGTPRMVHRHLFSSNAEVNTAAWGLTIALTFILFDIYIAAAMMAVFLIFGLSRAVNRLSHGTEAVRRGIFSVRIPVRRKDQVGELQRSFNEMSAHLEELVQAAAQKEALEKELEIARSVQERLIPSNPPHGERVEFSTHFEPSAAIGGDYFDILRVDHDRIAVVVADVSGHGLSAGLRMAMIKAGLQILVERSHDAYDILSRLDALVRQSDERRTFVTATLALFDLRSGRLEITNAGHPPVYLRRGDHGEVEEILLPSSPLGGLGQRYGRQELMLQPGDVLIWLSDGLIEATDEDGQPFGYERVRETLEAGGGSPEELRDRLLAAVRRHSAGRPAEDDRTLVVMRYLPARRPSVEEPREPTSATSVAAPSER